jgi:aromatic-L-amino-acid decarboxylase
MDAEAFRAYGHQIIDWIADYLAHPDRYPVLAQVQPGWVRDQLPKQPPDRPEPMEAILDDVNRVIVPGLTHWNHPAFMAYFAITGSGPGILGELLCSAFNVNAMLWKTSPAATELEEVVLDWLRQMLGLPPEFAGIIYDTASISSLHAIAAAREMVPGLNVREEGLSGRPDTPRLRLYASEQSHSSIDKGALTLGIGQAGIRKIPVDAEFRMDPAALKQAIEQDVAAGWRPFCVVATVGTTSTTSVDPVPAIAEICAAEGLWLHVDAAYGGGMLLSQRRPGLLAGIERADSVTIDPHKWFYAPLDAGAIVVRDAGRLAASYGLEPPYLRSADPERFDWVKIAH